MVVVAVTAGPVLFSFVLPFVLAFLLSGLSTRAFGGLLCFSIVWGGVQRMLRTFTWCWR